MTFIETQCGIQNESTNLGFTDFYAHTQHWILMSKPTLDMEAKRHIIYNWFTHCISHIVKVPSSFQSRVSKKTRPPAGTHSQAQCRKSSTDAAGCGSVFLPGCRLSPFLGSVWSKQTQILNLESVRVVFMDE